MKTSEKKTIGIVTFQYAANYGAVLQCWALCRFLTQHGFNVRILNNVPHLNFQNFYKNKLVDLAIRFCPQLVRCWRPAVAEQKITNLIFDRFRNSHLPELTKALYSEKRFRQQIEEIDIFISGSDQIWNIDMTGPLRHYFYLDFVPENKTKIAYAPSFGHGEWNHNDSDTREIIALLKRYDRISVREESGAEICREKFGVNAKVVLDPVLLLGRNDFRALFSRKETRSEYILVFAFNQDQKLIDFVREISRRRGERLLVVNANNRFSVEELVPQPTVGVLLELIDRSSFVITDSFHITIFSLLSHKEFIVLPARERGLSRLMDLLAMVETPDRLVLNGYTGVEKLKKLDFQQIDMLLDAARERSAQFLLQSCVNT